MSVLRHPGTRSQTSSDNTKNFLSERKRTAPGLCAVCWRCTRAGSAAMRGRPRREYGGLVTRDRVSTTGFVAGSRRTRRSSGAPAQLCRSASCGSAGNSPAPEMQTAVADPVVADAAKGPVGIRRLRVARTDSSFRVRLANSAKTSRPVRLAGRQGITDG